MARYLSNDSCLCFQIEKCTDCLSLELTPVSGDHRVRNVLNAVARRRISYLLCGFNWIWVVCWKLKFAREREGWGREAKRSENDVIRCNYLPSQMNNTSIPVRSRELSARSCQWWVALDLREANPVFEHLNEKRENVKFEHRSPYVESCGPICLDKGCSNPSLCHLLSDERLLVIPPLDNLPHLSSHVYIIRNVLYGRVRRGCGWGGVGKIVKYGGMTNERSSDKR